MVLADAVDEETGEEIPVAPRTILKRQVERAARRGLTRQGRLGVRVLRPQGLVGGAWPSAAGRSRSAFGYYNEDYHLLQATKAEPLHRLLRNQMTEARSPDRVQQGRGGATASTRSTSATTTSSSRPTGASLFKHGAKEIAYLNGWGITFMAKPDHRWTGSSGHLHMSLWDADGDAPADARTRTASRPARTACPTDRPAVHGRDDAAVARAGGLHRPVHQLVQALRVAVVGAGQRRLGPRQPDDRLPARRPRAGASTSRTASRAAT